MKLHNNKTNKKIFFFLTLIQLANIRIHTKYTKANRLALALHQPLTPCSDEWKCPWKTPSLPLLLLLLLLTDKSIIWLLDMCVIVLAPWYPGYPQPNTVL